VKKPREGGVDAGRDRADSGAFQLRADAVKVDSDRLEFAEQRGHLVQIALERWRRSAMIEIGLQRTLRHRDHRVAADECIHVPQVAVIAICDRGAGPQQTLLLRTVCGQQLPARRGEHTLVVLEYELRDRHRRSVA
jgi:hypothetical protein